MPTKRYCAPPDVIALLEREGIGWGHDLDCDCLTLAGAARTPGPLRRLARFLKRRG